MCQSCKAVWILDSVGAKFGDREGGLHGSSASTLGSCLKGAWLQVGGGPSPAVVLCVFACASV